jgi:uncharacterized protein YeeX (DUF496 family)
MLKRWIEHHYLKREFKRLERERQEIEQLREDTKHVLGNQLACRIADALATYGAHNLPYDAEMNDICAMLADYKQSRRDHLARSLCIDNQYDDALSRDIQIEQRRQALSKRFKNRRDASKKAGE